MKIFKHQIIKKAPGFASCFLGWVVAMMLVCPAMALCGAVQYSYDSMNRLVRAEYSTGQAIAYTYDKMGNRLTMSLSGVAGSALPGDLNGDCAVSLADAALALQTAAGMAPAAFRSDYGASGADPDGVQPMSLADVVWILQTVATE
ncbi:MAG: hypothetical protein JEZ02_20980 [Desulfatibacillum sp.]|nr:hypothetical protein [Desulfatibacillum sp.]